MPKDHPPTRKGQSPKPKTHKPERPRSVGPSFRERIAARPVRWAILAYALLTVIFFAGPIFSPGKMVFGSDTMSAGVFFRSLSAEFWRSHFRLPMWDPYIHAGLPFVDAMHGDIFYPASILQIILPVTYALGLKLILHVFLAGVFMFLFLRVLGRSDVGAFVGGLLYMWTPCLVSLVYPGHDGKMYVTALLPLAFLMVHRAVVTRRLPWFFGFGLVYALMILTAHVQMAYYASWGLGLYFLFLLWDQYRFQLRKIALPIVFFVLAVLLAGGASAVQWMAPYQYLAKYSQRIQHTEGRGYEWSSSWAMHSEELLSEVNPEFPGANLSSGPSTYWGQNFFKLNSEAVGVMAVALAVVAFVAARAPSIWFFAGLSLLALLHALGDSTPVFRLFFEFVPMVKKFRAPSMSSFLFAFSWVVMASRSLDLLLEPRRSGGVSVRRSRDPHRVLLVIAMVYSGIALIGLVTGPSLLTGWASAFGEPLTGEKAQAAAANANSMRIGFLIGAILLWALVGLFRLHKRGGLSQTGALGGLMALAVLPLWQFDARFVTTIDPKRSYGDRPILNLIRQNAPAPPERYRVLNLPRTLDDNYLALHGIEELSPSAMHGNHLLTHDNFVGRHDPTPALVTNAATLNLLNAVFIVAPQPVSRSGFTFVAQSQGLYLHRNQDALPRAAVFYQYEVNTDSNATLARIRSDDFPYRSRLILDQALPGLPPTDTLAPPVLFTPARMVAWDTDNFEVECSAERDGILWLSENYYPAWTATDETGRSLPIYRADYTFRAVPVTAGTHRIKFDFHSSVFANSVWLSLACLAILIAGCGWAAWVHRRPA
ncbi:MAG: hypothetical protein AB1792_03710 [Candidatus Zixiibacteriota bacterium]